MKKSTTYIGKVYKNIKNKILNGTFRPRQHIYENDLVKEFKVSRSPIREALARLQQEKFVYVVPRKGVYVSPVTKKEIVDIFEIRKNLEVLAFKRSSKNIQVEELKKLKKSFLEYKDLPLSQKNKLKYLSIDKKFHYLLFKNCNNERLKDLLIHFQEHMNRFQKYALNIDSFRISIKEHLDIIDSIEKGDVSLTTKYLLRHLNRVEKTYFYQFME